MNPKLKLFLVRWANDTVAVLVAANVIHGIHYDDWLGLVVAALLLGILNKFIRGILIFLSLPLVVVTLGVFILFINAFLLYCVGSVMTSFHVDSFMAAFCGGLIISIVSIVLNLLTGTGNMRVGVHRAAPPPADHDDKGNGPVIDV